MGTTGTYIANGPKMPKKPFSSEVMETYADRLVRHNLLLRSLGDEEHPCMKVEDSLLKEAEAHVRASADYCRRNAAWPMLRTWFSSRIMEIARGRLSHYRFPPPVGNAVLADIATVGFDHLLENRSGESGIMVSLGSNVLSLEQCKMS